LAIEVILGVAALIAPAWISSVIGMPTAADLPASTVWARAWGALLLWQVAFQIPSLRDPVRHRWGAVVGILGRLFLGLVYLLIGICVGAGVLWLALVELGLGLALALFYFRLLQAELMSRP
jgi:hypothetical protein